MSGHPYTKVTIATIQNFLVDLCAEDKGYTMNYEINKLVPKQEQFR